MLLVIVKSRILELKSNEMGPVGAELLARNVSHLGFLSNDIVGTEFKQVDHWGLLIIADIQFIVLFGKY